MEQATGWLWWAAGAAAVVLLIALLYSDIAVRALVSRVNNDDTIVLEWRAAFGLLRYRMEVPMIRFRGLGMGIELKSDMIQRRKDEGIAEYKTNVTYSKAVDYYRDLKQLVSHALGFSVWLNRSLAKVRCYEFRWFTEAGIGGAAETAVLTGAIWGLKSSLTAAACRKIRMEARPLLDVRPLFNQSQFSTRLVFRLALRHIDALIIAFMLLRRILQVKGGLKLWRQAWKRARTFWKLRKREKAQA